jgi:hypothetical protein
MDTKESVMNAEDRIEKLLEDCQLPVFPVRTDVGAKPHSNNERIYLTVWHQFLDGDRVEKTEDFSMSACGTVNFTHSEMPKRMSKKTSSRSFCFACSVNGLGSLSKDHFEISVLLVIAYITD